MASCCHWELGIGNDVVVVDHGKLLNSLKLFGSELGEKLLAFSAQYVISIFKAINDQSPLLC